MNTNQVTNTAHRDFWVCSQLFKLRSLSGCCHPCTHSRGPTLTQTGLTVHLFLHSLLYLALSSYTIVSKVPNVYLDSTCQLID